MSDVLREESYSEVKERLDQIVASVKSDDLPLEDALNLYEEAIKLGTRLGTLIEQDIKLSSEADDTRFDESEREADVFEGFAKESSVEETTL